LSRQGNELEKRIGYFFFNIVVLNKNFRMHFLVIICYGNYHRAALDY